MVIQGCNGLYPTMYSNSPDWSAVSSPKQLAILELELLGSLTRTYLVWKAV